MSQQESQMAPKSLMDFVKAAKAQIREWSPQQAHEFLQERNDALVLDVRESSEHEQGHIQGALLVPRGLLEAAADSGFPQHVPQLANARQRPVVVYCATGGRSAMAAATLQMMGFEQVYSVDGGFGRWEKEGLPVVREARYV